MTETQSRTQTARETQQDFFAGYQPLSPTTDRIAAPEFRPYTFDASAPDSEVSYYQTPSYTQTQEPAFEVEKQYTFDTSSYEQEETRTMATPSIQRNTEIVAREEETKVQIKTAAKAKLNARGKIMISVYSIVVAIIVAFCIYNAVAINGLQSDIAYKDGIVATQTEIVAGLQNTYNNLGLDDTIIASTAGEFKAPTDADIVKVGGFELTERPAAETQSNWFEDLCEAIRKLFS